MSLAQFAADHNVALTDRVELADKIKRFVLGKNYAFNKETPVLQNEGMKKHVLNAGVGALVVAALFLLAAMMNLTVGEVQIPLLIALFYTGYHAYALRERILEGVGPYHIKLYVVESYNGLPSEFQKLSTDLQHSTQAFFETFPGGKVYFGALYKGQSFMQPTSLRFEHDQETVNVWTEPSVFSV